VGFVAGIWMEEEVELWRRPSCSTEVGRENRKGGGEEEDKEENMVESTRVRSVRITR
jgi:hypothetical protein